MQTAEETETTAMVRMIPIMVTLEIRVIIVLTAGMLAQNESFE